MNLKGLTGWTRLEKLQIETNSKEKWVFPVLPRLRKFRANLTVDESIFCTLAHSPKLEVVSRFCLGAGSTSGFLLVSSIPSLITKNSNSLGKSYLWIFEISQIALLSQFYQ